MKYLFFLFILTSCFQKESIKPVKKEATFSAKEIQDLREKYFQYGDKINVYFISKADTAYAKIAEETVRMMESEHTFSSEKIIHLNHSGISSKSFTQLMSLFELPQKSYIYLMFYQEDENKEEFKKNINLIQSRLSKLGHISYHIDLPKKSKSEVVQYLIDHHLQGRLTPL